MNITNKALLITSALYSNNPVKLIVILLATDIANSSRFYAAIYITLLACRGFSCYEGRFVLTNQQNYYSVPYSNKLAITQI